MEPTDGGLEKLKRVGFCLAVASLVNFLVLVVAQERPPVSEAVRLWLFSHLGPLALFPHHWTTGVVSLSLCLVLILPTLRTPNKWFLCSCTGGFVLWQQVGLWAIAGTI